MDLIGEDIQITNFNLIEKNSCIDVMYSCNNEEQLHKFNNIYLIATKSMIAVSDKIYIHWFDSFGSHDEISTNMDEEFLLKHYSYNKLNQEILDKKSRPKIKL